MNLSPENKVDTQLSMDLGFHDVLAPQISNDELSELDFEYYDLDFDRLDRVSGPYCGCAADVKHCMGEKSYTELVYEAVDNIAKLEITNRQVVDCIKNALADYKYAAKRGEFLRGITNNEEIGDYFLKNGEYEEIKRDIADAEKAGRVAIAEALASKALINLNIQPHIDNGTVTVDEVADVFRERYIYDSDDTDRQRGEKHRRKLKLFNAIGLTKRDQRTGKY